MRAATLPARATPISGIGHSTAERHHAELWEGMVADGTPFVVEA